MLGDLLEQALSTVGITKERVERWIGGPCGCEERKDKLNAVGFWVQRVLSGKTEKAGEHLERLMGEDQK